MMTPREETKQQAILTIAHHDYERRLNSYAFLKVSNQNTGQDLVQATFLKTWRYLVKGGKIDIMKAFLYHVLNGLIVDEYRKQKHKTISLNALLEKGFEPSTGDFKQIFNLLDGKSALILISRLPKNYQNIMRMRYVQNLSTTEISLITGQTKNTVTVQAYRGLNKLRLLYGLT